MTYGRGGQTDDSEGEGVHGGEQIKNDQRAGSPAGHRVTATVIDGGGEVSEKNCLLPFSHGMVRKCNVLRFALLGSADIVAIKSNAVRVPCSLSACVWVVHSPTSSHCVFQSYKGEGCLPVMVQAGLQPEQRSQTQSAA